MNETVEEGKRKRTSAHTTIKKRLKIKPDSFSSKESNSDSESDSSSKSSSESDTNSERKEITPH
jgi:hypothetical protein